MIVLIDTNVLLGMFTTGHAHRPIFDAWFAGSLNWATSTEILLEYEEVMQRQGSLQKAEKMMAIMALVNERHENVLRISPTFHFHLNTGDPDDDRFAD